MGCSSRFYCQILFRNYISIMPKIRKIFKCSACGAQASQWMGQCPHCREWNTLEEVQTGALNKERTRTGRYEDKAIILSEADDSAFSPFTSGLKGLDRILGHGLVPGSSILVGGEPGIGKSTLLLQVCGSVADSGKKVLYASGEESLPQIKARAERLKALSPNLLALSSTRVEDVLDSLESDPPALLIADSVQTMASSDAEGLPGNVSQVKAVATALTETCRKIGTCLVLVGHVTKDGNLAGPRMLEHMVDTVISIEGDRRQMFRLLRVFKNRFGPNEELLVFHMQSKGLELVDDPSTFFLEARDSSLSGTALVMAMEGHRPLVVEVQALVSRTFLNIPRRSALGFDVNRLHLLLAVMEKRLKLNFAQVDIYAKVGGGIKLTEPGLDLALEAAILSSYYDIPLPEKSIFWGEVDLNGQIRPVSGHRQRLSQAKRLGFSPIICSPVQNGEKMESPSFSTLAQIQKTLFHKNHKNGTGNRTQVPGC